jgi:hypothetical protein
VAGTRWQRASENMPRSPTGSNPTGPTAQWAAAQSAATCGIGPALHLRSALPFSNRSGRAGTQSQVCIVTSSKGSPHARVTLFHGAGSCTSRKGAVGYTCLYWAPPDVKVYSGTEHGTVGVVSLVIQVQVSLSCYPHSHLPAVCPIGMSVGCDGRPAPRAAVQPAHLMPLLGATGCRHTLTHGATHSLSCLAEGRGSWSGPRFVHYINTCLCNAQTKLDCPCKSSGPRGSTTQRYKSDLRLTTRCTMG